MLGSVRGSVPTPLHAFRMLCRHNRWVQDFGQVRDADEISRRERVWWQFVRRLEEESGTPVGALPATDFRVALANAIEVLSFEPRRP